jgi:hemolysin III
MFLASGIYHSLPATYEHKLLWRHLDHSMIWWAIAGSVSATYTLAFPREKLGRRVVWLLAVGGVLLETLFLEDLPLWLSPTLYVCMGLTGIVPLVRIMRWFGFRFASPLLYGGIASITGAVIEAVRAPNLWPRVFEAHELLHCFIVLGMALFWVGIRRFTTIESEALAEAALSSA